MPQLPDGKFEGAFALLPIEQALREKLKATYSDRTLLVARSAHLTRAKGARGPCQYRTICARGCSYGAYFSTQSSTLPAATATGRLTLVTDTVVDRLDYDAATRKITGVRTLNVQTKKRSIFTSKVVFLCAGTIDSVGVLLRSTSSTNPNGLANSSGVLGQYIMDHAGGAGAGVAVRGYENRTSFGNRPTATIIPRFRNLDGQDADFVRGYVFFGSANQTSWRSAETKPGIGESAKTARHAPGQWTMGMHVHAECLPRAENRVTLAKNAVDKDGLPQMHIEFTYGENERKMLIDAEQQARAMLSLLGGPIVRSSHQPGPGGSTVHEMGGARMGGDPKTSVVNADNQAHDALNLFITDGSCMSSSASVNPSLTYMALTARAAATAAAMVKDGRL